MTAQSIKASDLLTPEELERVRARSDWKGAYLVANCWAWIAGAMALFALWPGVLTFLLAVLIIGGRQLGLFVLMHDTAHGALTQSQKLNDFLGHYLLAAPAFGDMESYRHYHLKHHRHTQQPEDPDLFLSKPFPITKASFLRKILRDLSGLTFLKLRAYEIKSVWGAKGTPLTVRLGSLGRKYGTALLVNLFMLMAFWVFGKPHFYVLFWLLPLMTVFMLIYRLRSMAEHAMVPDDNDPFRNARTTFVDPVVRLFLMPYFVNYHVEHHLFMWVPCYNLPVLHAMLKKKGHVERMETAPDYWSVLAKVTSKEAPAPAAA